MPKAPKTWDEMIDEGVKLGPDKGLIEVQADKYEGLVVWFNQLLESAGGHILAGPEEIDLQQEPTERALEIMGKLSTSDAADPAITTSEEDPARLAFEAGSAAFQINYPFVYPSAKENAPDIFKVMKAAKYPQVDPRPAERAAARRDQPRRLGLLREPGPRLRGDPVPDQAGEPDRDRGRRRAAARCARTSTTRRTSRRPTRASRS